MFALYIKMSIMALMFHRTVGLKMQKFEQKTAVNSVLGRYTNVGTTVEKILNCFSDLMLRCWMQFFYGLNFLRNNSCNSHSSLPTTYNNQYKIKSQIKKKKKLQHFWFDLTLNNLEPLEKTTQNQFKEDHFVP